ncbi:MAG TPA: hypothetical protein VMZ90_12840, partial [Vicinamibacterales bacterium]|nr:hypothetical protein [Vicinamibacterales bacterium]
MAAKKQGARHMREWSEGDMKKLRAFAKSKVSARVAASKDVHTRSTSEAAAASTTNTWRICLTHRSAGSTRIELR